MAKHSAQRLGAVRAVAFGTSGRARVEVVRQARRAGVTVHAALPQPARPAAGLAARPRVGIGPVGRNGRCTHGVTVAAPMTASYPTSTVRSAMAAKMLCLSSMAVRSAVSSRHPNGCEVATRVSSNPST